MVKEKPRPPATWKIAHDIPGVSLYTESLKDFTRVIKNNFRKGKDHPHKLRRRIIELGKVFGGGEREMFTFKDFDGLTMALIVPSSQEVHEVMYNELEKFVNVING